MRKIGLVIAGGIAAVVLLSTIGPMVGLLVSLVLLYFIFKKFLKAESTKRKIALGIIGLIVSLVSIHNIPALIGVVAAYVLYLVCKKWNKQRHYGKENSDPFVNFEKQWNDLKKL